MYLRFYSERIVSVYIPANLFFYTKFIFQQLENKTLDAEFVRLLHEVHSEDIPGHIYRGYTIVKKEGQNEPIRHIEVSIARSI